MAHSEPERDCLSDTDNESSSIDHDNDLSVEPVFDRQSGNNLSYYQHVAALKDLDLSQVKAEYNMDVINKNYNQQYNETIGIIMIRTTKANEMKLCGCLDIYSGLYLMCIYHSLIIVPYFYFSSIMFYSHFQTLTSDDVKLSIFILTIIFGLFRMMICILGMYLIPNFKRHKLSTLDANKFQKISTRIWLAALLICPVLCDLALVLTYIESIINTENEDIFMTETDMVIMFIIICIELLVSIYFFFVTNTFMSLKWPSLRQ